MNPSDFKQPGGSERIRPLNVPQAVVVETDDRGCPKQVSGVETRRTGKMVQRWTRAVETVVETWRVDDEWWREPISRQCVEVVLEAGRHVVLYEDLMTGNWFLQKP